MLRQKRVKLWRETSNPFFELHQARGDVKNPTDLAYFLSQGVIEFIPEVSTIFDLNRTDTIIIDLDPKDPNKHSFEDTRQATKVVYASLLTKGSPLREALSVVSVKLRFSGNRSFHIYIRLDRPHRFEEIRDPVKASLDTVTKMYPRDLSYRNLRSADGSGRDDYILIDIGALSRHRCVRSLWSVHHKTKLVCVPVDDLDTFDRECSTMEAVLAKGKTLESFS